MENDKQPLKVDVSNKQKFRAWDKVSNRWRDEFDWIVCPESGKPRFVHDNEFIQSYADQLILSRSTGIFDISGIEIFEYDVVIPSNFKDVPNLVQFIGNGFYRVKTHGAKKYINILGSCELKIIGHMFAPPKQNEPEQ